MKEGDDAALTEKRDKVANNKKKDGKDEANAQETGDERQVTTAKPTTKAKTTKATTKATTQPIVVTTAATEPSKAPVTTGNFNFNRKSNHHL